MLFSYAARKPEEEPEPMTLYQRNNQCGKRSPDLDQKHVPVICFRQLDYVGMNKRDENRTYTENSECPNEFSYPF
jgi:hypothetical protein